MVRHIGDATRFTQTGPYASAKSSAASTVKFDTTPPPNETLEQKVRRLREAAWKARLPKETGWDKVYRRGRGAADVAHKVVTTSLIGFSIIAAGFAAVSLGDMMLYNSKKKKLWIAQQQLNYDRALTQALEAEANGSLTQELRLFLNHERAVEQAEMEAKTKGTLFERVKKAAFGELAMEDKPGGALGTTMGFTRTAPLASRVDASASASTSSLSSPLPSSSSSSKTPLPAGSSPPSPTSPSSASSLLHSTSPPRSSTTGAGAGSGRTQTGQLDQYGSNAASAIATQTSSIRSWLGWR